MRHETAVSHDEHRGLEAPPCGVSAGRGIRPCGPQREDLERVRLANQPLMSLVTDILRRWSVPWSR